MPEENGIIWLKRGEPFSIMALASVKIAKPGIAGNRVNSIYNSSFTSIFLPGVNTWYQKSVLTNGLMAVQLDRNE